MNVRQLIESLSALPPDAKVRVSYEGGARLNVEQVVLIEGEALLDANGRGRHDRPPYFPPLPD